MRLWVPVSWDRSRIGHTLSPRTLFQPVDVRKPTKPCDYEEALLSETGSIKILLRYRLDAHLVIIHSNFPVSHSQRGVHLPDVPGQRSHPRRCHYWRYERRHWHRSRGSTTTWLHQNYYSHFLSKLVPSTKSAR